MALQRWSRSAGLMIAPGGSPRGLALPATAHLRKARSICGEWKTTWPGVGGAGRTFSVSLADAHGVAVAQPARKAKGGRGGEKPNMAPSLGRLSIQNWSPHALSMMGSSYLAASSLVPPAWSIWAW